MKHKFNFYTILLLLTFFSIGGCKKHKDNPVDQLPPETQTGAGTFGCLVNGEVFKPKGSPFAGPILSCAYQFINNGYYFQLTARKDNDSEIFGLGLFTDSLAIFQGQNIKLSQHDSKGKAYGQYSHYFNNGGILYYSDPIGSGMLNITFLDSVNRIISGTFWFDATDSTGEKVEVREGRFDMKYTL